MAACLEGHTLPSWIEDSVLAKIRFAPLKTALVKKIENVFFTNSWNGAHKLSLLYGKSMLWRYIITRGNSF
jgi:hypothetical protein